MCRSLLVLLPFILIAGCSDSSPSSSPPSPATKEIKEEVAASSLSSPPTEEIDKGVDWALSAFINWNDQSRSLFSSYKITNQYTEKRDDGTAYVYDFKAECKVVLGMETWDNQGGHTPSHWIQGFPANPGASKSFTGTFTLIKKGEKWYRKETVR